MNVLSLFDGMSCGQIALDRLGIEVDKYYASEIDKYAMSIAKKNYPNTIHIGDVTKVNGEDLPKIDLLMGGSPCQGFSFAGKQLNFDDPRSELFFEFVRLLKETKPKYFLLENVRMKQEYQDVISEHLGVKPIMINSALVSAQNRVRLYWTNIPNIEQPEDKGIVLKDIIEDGVTDRTKSHCLDANYFKGGNLKSYFEKHRRQLIFSKDGLYHVKGAAKRNQVTKRGIEAQLNIRKDDKSNCVVASWSHKLNGCVEYRPCELKEFNQDSTCHHAATATDIKGNESIKRVYAETGKSPTLTTMGGGHREPKVLCGAWRGRYIVDGKRQDHKGSVAGKTEQRLEIRQDEKTNTLTTVQKDNNVVIGATYRKLTPMECERLQTVPDNYTDGVSNTQRYKMLGNGWTVDVIAHILKEIAKERIND